ncbi:hypothetical protein [Candidatus Doolittlea endobia]|uniref:hypothetical protein n=1 Tax=Candidatus Doolittlea endobia TaxID=1778262 RepID=UPI001315089A|nr:hypothetical protein [Candidatus Doolittlea endobia]
MRLIFDYRCSSEYFVFIAEIGLTLVISFVEHKQFTSPGAQGKEHLQVFIK